MLGDLHNAEYGPDNEVLLSACASLDPDIIFCVGDMLIGNSLIPFEPAAFFLENLAKLAPIYFSNGNHETRTRFFSGEYAGKYSDFENRLLTSGIHILNNRDETAKIKESDFHIYGLEIPLEKYQKFRRAHLSPEELTGLIGVSDQNAFSVLLAHNPEFARTYFGWGADLTLSGHFHGGVIRTIRNRAVLNPYGSFFPKYGYGGFKKNGRNLIVTSGLGDHFIPVRIHNPWEIVSIILEPAD